MEADSDLTYAFAGPESASPDVKGYLRQTMASLPSPSRYITGAAHGIDTYAAEVAYELWPNAEHVIVVPNFRHNERHVAEMEALGSRVIRMPSNTGPLDRNVEMIRRAHEIVAYPKHSKEQMRSGTWATIRKGRKAGRHIHMFPLSETAAQQAHAAR